MLGFLAHVDGLRGEMWEARLETIRGGVLFLHAELRRREREKSEEEKTRN